MKPERARVTKAVTRSLRYSRPWKYLGWITRIEVRIPSAIVWRLIDNG